MSILSSIGSGIKSAYSSVKNFLTTPFAGTGANKANLASSNAMQFPLLPGTGLNGPNQTLAPNISTPKGLGQTQPDGSIVILNTRGTPSGITIPSSAISPAASNSPTVISASTTPASSRIVADSFGSTSPSTLSSSALAGGSDAGGGGSSASAPSTGGSTNFPTTPQYNNVGAPNMSGTASVLQGTHTYDPVKGFAPITKGDALDAQRQKDAEAMRRMIPEMKSPYDNPEVQAAQAERDVKQQELNNYTSQLNSVVAKQQQDLLQQKHAIAQEGGTEAGWNGREAEINYQAAVAALPLQALVATAQGNLQLAQTHLTDLTKIVTDRLEKNYQYKKDLFAFAKSNSDNENKIKLDRLEKATDRAVADKRDAMNFAQSLVLKYGDQPDVLNSVANLMRYHSDSPTLGVDLMNVAGKVSSGESSSSFIDIIQQSIDAGATPEQAAREAATVSENSGIQVDQKVLSQWVTQAKSLKRTPQAEADKLIESIRKSLFQ